MRLKESIRISHWKGGCHSLYQPMISPLIGDDDLCQFLFPSELINWAFEVIQPVSWRGMLPDFLVIFAAMVWLDSLCLHRWATKNCSNLLLVLQQKIDLQRSEFQK
ncbi:hypothetical protein H5410_043248 [Solanum commersonii]|uniref:Uncharacterized protein n=1 Tax=Solanum commersonii TaxID=4109 RepID=A0A9J5Y0V7_SOLCO|nr:hypothetical protein H5410_043248 [Solanum commersonii]